MEVTTRRESVEAKSPDPARQTDTHRFALVRTCGFQDYDTTVAAMRAFSFARDDSTPDEIWVTEHPSTYTLGQAGRIAHLRHAVDVPVVQVERGGQITFHGPGQLVVYPLIDIRRRGIKVRQLVSLIERSVVRALATYNLSASLKPGAPGVYVSHGEHLAKIAALGLKIVNGRSFHGLSLNVAMDLSPFDAIDVCGYADLKSVDLRSLGVSTTVEEAGRLVSQALLDELEAASEERR